MPPPPSGPAPGVRTADPAAGTARDTAEVARLWVQGLQGDITALAGLMAPSTRIWHSHDGEWLSLDESTARMAAQPSGRAAALPSFGDVRAQATDTGVLVQATLAAGVPGQPPTHIVQVLTVEDGTVTRVEEYIAAQSGPG